MSLNKAIASGKEKRKPFKGPKAIDHTCRNNGSCPYCASNRLHSRMKREQEAINKLSAVADE